jgi:hypothetical protein
LKPTPGPYEHDATVRRFGLDSADASWKLGRHVHIATGDLDAFIATGHVEVGKLLTLTLKGA